MLPSRPAWRLAPRGLETGQTMDCYYRDWRTGDRMGWASEAISRYGVAEIAERPLTGLELGTLLASGAFHPSRSYVMTILSVGLVQMGQQLDEPAQRPTCGLTMGNCGGRLEGPHVGGARPAAVLETVVHVWVFVGEW
ncbi:unnamed protein product [Protopolystoma xenopodis]|uniref:Uncharacterized protein n=1 Tax=Protopolystoma xenopodis TaxID=117903 RepID=A0A3S5BF36_9PLAT|nr:unnamed protein product [Protopolystoma xenopodis]